MNIILASSSPRRKEILTNEGYNFIIDSKDIDETMDNLSTPIENAKRIALMKAKAVSDKYPNDIIIGCDTIVVYDNIIYGKPKDESHAKEMLKKFSGNTHEVISGVAIITPNKIYNLVDVSKVKFKELSNKIIDSYIKTKEPFGKAGSYAIQGYGSNLIEDYEGDLDNIIGLPIHIIKPIIDSVLNHEMED